MANENETRVSREDALNTAESLFGDTESSAANTVPKEQDAKSETGQHDQGSEVGEGEAAEDEASPHEDLKVVVSIKAGRATIGVQQPSSDPHIETVDAPDLSGMTQEVLAVVERARAKWEEEPKYPTHERPAPPARRRTQREQGAAQASTAEGGGAEEQQEALRLF